MRKLTFCLIVFLCFGSAIQIFAQGTGESPNGEKVLVKDKFKLRQELYQRNQVAFPPPTKDRWSFGLQGGVPFISGDVTASQGYAGGFNIRKSLGHLLSLRAQFTTGRATGLNWRPSGGFLNNEALNGTNASAINYTTSSYPFVFYNYQMRYYDFGLHGVFNLGNLSFTNKEPKLSASLFAGPGALLYATYTDAADANGNPYNYAGIPTDEVLSVKQEVVNGLRNLYDGTYETRAESYSYKNKLFNRTLIPTVQFGLGLAYKLSNHVDLGLEHRVTWASDDLLDGQRWEETLTPSASNDFQHFTSVNLNFRLGKKRADSRWWTNPLKGPLTDIRDLKRGNFDNFKDSDKDGVPNTRDKEANTPEGVNVDSRGVALDSDGDGLADYKDKEPFTPKGAAVDKGGMAIDRDRDGVIDLYDQEPNSPAGVHVNPKGIEITGIQAQEDASGLENPLPMVHFDLGKAEVKQEFYPDLLRVARFMTANPETKMRVVGHTDVRGSGDSNYELSKMRTSNVADILTGTFGIDKSRLILDHKGSDQLLVKGLPGVYKEKNEALHYLNRRVEFVLD